MEIKMIIEKPKIMPLCKCDCGERLIWRKQMKWCNIPEYIRGHNIKGKNNPFSGKHHTEEHNKKIRNSNYHKNLKGKFLIKFSTEDKNKIINMYSKEKRTIKEISQIFNLSVTPIKRVLLENGIKIKKGGGSLSGERNPFSGKKHSEDSKIKMSESHIGIPSKKKIKLNLNLIRHLYSDKGVSPKEIGEIVNVSISTVYNRLKEMRVPTSERVYKKGIQKIKESLKGITLSKQHKLNLKMARSKQILPLKDTSIEVKIQDFLKALHVEFFTHQYMHIEHGYQCDILIPQQETEGVVIPQKTIIECDGDYWHGNSQKYSEKQLGEKILKQREVDKSRTKELIEKGYRVVRLWEHEIRNMDSDGFKEKLT